VTAFTTFLPLIIQGMGYSGIRASLMSVPPFVVGTVGLIILVCLSDHFRDRSLFLVISLVIALIGCIVMATSENLQLRYGFTHVCMAGVFAGAPLAAVWLTGNTPWKVNDAFLSCLLLSTFHRADKDDLVWRNRVRDPSFLASTGGPTSPASLPASFIRASTPRCINTRLPSP